LASNAVLTKFFNKMIFSIYIIKIHVYESSFVLKDMITSFPKFPYIVPTY
jgi:hypothetical protein